MTQSHLIVKEEGICIYRVPEKPEFSALQMLSPATNSECVKAIEDWKEAVKQAQSSAILVEDQQRAKEIIKSKFGHDLDQMTINTKGYIYPVPGIEFEEVNTCKWHGNLDACGNETCWDLVECQKSPSKTVARLIEHTAEKESPEIDKEEESQDELWNDIDQNYILWRDQQMNLTQIKADFILIRRTN